jgi:hypothetical protein
MKKYLTECYVCGKKGEYGKDIKYIWRSPLVCKYHQSGEIIKMLSIPTYLILALPVVFLIKSSGNVFLGLTPLIIPAMMYYIIEIMRNIERHNASVKKIKNQGK